MEGQIKITVTKNFNVPAKKVFDAWLDTDFLSKWMFGPDVRDEEIIKLETNPEKYGTFSFMVRRGDDVLNHLGTYLEVDRPTDWYLPGELKGNRKRKVR